MKKDIKTSNSLRNIALTALIAAPALIVPSAHALPSTDAANLTVTNGTATFDKTTNYLNITASNKAILTWGEFGNGGNAIAAADEIKYTIGAGNAVLNRIKNSSVTPTLIDGKITSDGKVYVLNPNGVTIGATASIDTQGFVVSTVAEPDSNFSTNGDLSYIGTATTAVAINAGAAIKGSTYVVGNGVTVTGVTLTGGTASFKSITGALSFTGTSEKALSLTTDAGAITVGTIGSKDAVTVTSGSTIALTSIDATVAGADAKAAVTLKAASGAISGVVKSSTLTVSTKKDADVTINGASANDVVLAYGNNISITDADDVKIGASTAFGTLSVTSTAGSILANGTDLVSVAGATSLTTSAADKNITLNAAGNLTVGTISVAAAGAGGGSTVSLTAVGKLNLGATTNANSAKAINLTATGGDIASTGVLKATTLTFTTDKSALFSGANVVTNLVAKGGVSDGKGIAGTVSVAEDNKGSYFNSAGAFTLAKGTATTGDLWIASAGTVTVGAAAADVVTVGGKLKVVNSAGAVATTADAFTVTGDLDITTTNGAVTLGTSKGLASFGALNISSGSGAIAVTEGFTTNLGAITTTGGIAVDNKDGGITNTGKLDVNALDVKSTGSVVLTNSKNLVDLLTISSDSAVTLTNAEATVITAKTGITKLVTANVGNNNLTINTDGGADSDYSSVSFTAKGDTAANVISIVDNKGGLTLVDSTYTTGTTDGTVSVSAAAGTLTLGSGINIGTKSATATAFTGQSIVDSTGGVNVYGDVSFTATKGGITLLNTGNSFGKVSAANGGGSDAADIVITEQGKLVIAALNAGAKNATIVSATGDIDASAAAITAKTLTASAVAGGVKANNAGNAVSGALTLTAKSDSSFVDTARVSLGNVKVTEGGLTVSTTAAIDPDNAGISQVSGKTIAIYGTSSFTAANNAKITLTNANNNFGGLVLSTGGAASIKEYNTINLKKVDAASLTLTSETADIRDLAAAVKVGLEDGIDNKVAVTGLTTLVAGNVIDITSTDGAFGQVSISAPGAAKLVSTGALDILSSSSAALTIKTTGALTQSGKITSTGLTTFDVGANALTLNGGQNTFGDLLVTAGVTTIVENEATTLSAGNKITGAATITSAGDISTVGAGGSTFSSTLALNANGKITVSNPLFLVGKLTVNATGKVDLSVLSKAGNLNGIDVAGLKAGDVGPSN